MQNRSDDKGFTLIEVIITLVLVAITAALAGMLIVSVVNGYIFAKINAKTAQNGQLAMTRLVKELTALQLHSVTGESGTGITYTRTDSALGTVNVAISQNGNTVELNGKRLTDSLSANGFSLRYCDTNNSCGTAWSPTIRVIEITLTFTGANNITYPPLVQRVTPRNS